MLETKIRNWKKYLRYITSRLESRLSTLEIEKNLKLVIEDTDSIML